MSNIPKVSVVFSNGNLLKNIPAIDGFGAIIGSGTGSVAMPLLTPKEVNSLQDAEALGIIATAVAAVVAVAATGTLTVTAIGSNTDTIDEAVDGVSITGGPVAKTSSETTPTLLAAKIAAAINTATGTNGGYTAANVGAVITVTAPSSLGATVNTLTLDSTIVGGITETDTPFANGVTGVTAENNTDMYKAVKEFYQELGGNQTLYIMLVANTVKMSTMLDSTNTTLANKLVEFAEGKISNLAVYRVPDGGYSAGSDFFDSDVEPAVLASKSFVQALNGKLKFLRVLIEGKIADETSTTIFSPNTASNGFAGVVLGDTKTGTGAAVGVALGRRMKYATHIKLGKVANGPLVASAIYIGTKKLKDVTNLDTLHGKGVISFVIYPQKAGFYFGIDNMASDDDYRILVHGGVVDAAAKIAANVYIDELEGEVDTNPDGTITDLDAKHLEDRVEQQAKVTLGDRISDIEALVDRTVNIINTSTTKIKIRVRPKGYNTFIDVDLGLTAGTVA